jgi:hypothetical protein
MKRAMTEISEQVTENKVDIEILQERMKKQDSHNESFVDIFENVIVSIDEMDREIRFLKKLAAGLVFISGGLFVLLTKNKAEIQEIRKVMNEG